MSIHAIVHLIGPTRVFKTSTYFRSPPKIFSITIDAEIEDIIGEKSKTNDGEFELPELLCEALIRATDCKISHNYIVEPLSPVPASKLLIKDDEWMVVLK